MDREHLLQMKFQQTLELLILYKKQNPLKNVYLSEKCASEALKWYQGYLNILGQNIKE